MIAIWLPEPMSADKSKTQKLIIDENYDWKNQKM